MAVFEFTDYEVSVNGLYEISDKAYEGSGYARLRFVYAMMARFERLAAIGELRSAFFESSIRINVPSKSGYDWDRGSEVWFGIHPTEWGAYLRMGAYGEHRIIAAYNAETGVIRRVDPRKIMACGFYQGDDRMLWCGFNDHEGWLSVCDDCGKVDGDSGTVNYNFGTCYVCGDCKKAKGYVACPRCGNYVDPDDLREVYVDYDAYEEWCKHCVSEETIYCDYHDRYESEDSFDFSEIRGYGLVCEDALEESDSFEQCSNCGEWYVAGDGRWCEDDEWRCDSCAEEWADENEYDRDDIHSYSFKPSPVFHHADGTTGSDEHGDELYLGVELEVDTDSYSKRDEFVGVIGQDHDGDEFYLKSDGSLDFGVELVTHPYSSDVIVDSPLWDDITSRALNTGMRSHDARTCGLHVHLNRAFFGEGMEQECNIAKLCFVFEAFEDKLWQFSRRNSSQHRWCYVDSREFSPKDSAEETRSKLREASRDRYRAVNLCNRNTVEVRMWRGTLNNKTLRATLDFTQALAKYVKATEFEKINDLVTFEGLLNALAPYAKNIVRIKEYAKSRNCID